MPPGTTPLPRRRRGTSRITWPSGGASRSSGEQRAATAHSLRLQIGIAPARRLSLLDGQAGRSPAWDNASRLVACSAEAGVHVRHVGVAGPCEQLAGVLGPSAGLAPDDELRGGCKVARDDGDEVGVRYGLTGGRIEEDDGHVAGTRGMARLELGLGTDVE